MMFSYKAYRLLLSFSFLYVVLGTQAEAVPSMRLETTSAVGDSLGGGRPRTYTQNDGLLVGPEVGYSTPGRLDYVQFFLQPIAPDFDKTFSIDVSTKQLGVPLAPGQYEGAERAAFARAGRPGIDVTIDYAGCNSISGQFEILRITLNGQQQITYFDVQFEVLCEGRTAPLRGRFAFDASGAPISFAAAATTVPTLTPAQCLLLAFFICAMAASARRHALDKHSDS
jgi:hypothetical protein